MCDSSVNELIALVMPITNCIKATRKVFWSNKKINENVNWINEPYTIVEIKFNFFLIKLCNNAPKITPIPHNDNDRPM